MLSHTDRSYIDMIAIIQMLLEDLFCNAEMKMQKLDKY